MQALPYLQLRDSESPTSSEKKSYRLSLHETSIKTTQHGDGQTRSGQNVNRSDYSPENTMQFEGSNSVYFGDIPQFRTPLPSPSPSKILKPSRKVQTQSSLPVWVEPLGVWLTNRKKCNSYETFSRNVELLRRTSDMFLDPCPHIPRCSHERTLSALRRQKQRFKTDEEFKKQERHLRIIERVHQFRELWEQWTDKAKSVGAEHEKRFDSFRKSRDGYTDPDEIIRKKRDERIVREKQIRLESEKRREEFLRKKRFKLPKIIVTYYDDKEEKRPVSQCSSLSSKSRLPSLVNIPSGESNKDNESDSESPGSKGDRLELPEIERYCPEEYSEETQRGEVLPDNETELEPGKGSDPLEIDVGFDMQNVVPEEVSEDNTGDQTQNVVDGEILQDKHENVLEEELGLTNESVLDDEVLEDKNKNVKKDVSPLAETAESENAPSSNNEDTKTDEQNMLRLHQDETLEKADKHNADNKNDTEILKGKESKGKGEEDEDNKEIQMNYLLPASVVGMAGENGSEGSICEADDTACLMSAFIPIAMGVGNGIIPNDAMRASSVFDRYHVPSQARLNNTRQGKKAGAWRPKINDKKQYLEIDLGAVSKVTQVSTQGYPTPIGVKVPKKDKCWVESYTLAFSTDGSQWQQYTENGVVKCFKGNRDNNSVVINSLLNPVEARFVRFIPQSWKSSIALRVEVYGEVAEPDLTAVTPPPSSPTSVSEEPVGDMILEEEEEAEVEEFVCAAEEEQLDEQDVWEEDTVDSVVETASHIESKVAVLSRSPSGIADLTVQGEKQQKTKSKGKSKKPKQDKPEENEEKKKKKKKKKKFKEKKAKAPLATSLSLVEEVEEDEGASSPEEEEDEQEQEEDTQINSPILPEIPKRPASVTRMPPAPRRSLSMFPERKDENESKPRRRRAQTDDSIRNELLRQQLAEDRRKKLAAVMDKSKKEIQAQSPVYDSSAGRSDLDDFLTKYCIISEGQANYYRRIFKTFDENEDGFLFPEEVLEALESVNSNLLSDSHINYIYRVLELCDCSLEAGADLKLFSVVAAFSQRVAVLDEFAKILLSKLDFRELDFKLQKAKRLFLCYVDEAKKTISLEELMLGLTAGGLTADQREQTLKVLGRATALDFLDFLTYIPLFIHIHDHILQDPLGTVVYRDMLAV